MKMGIIIGTNEPETVWNALRLGTTALKSDHEVSVFLLNKGVEIEEIKSEKYDVKEQIQSFVENKGKVLACGTCLKSRNKESNDTCPISTMQDLLKIVEESDKVLTFG